MTEESPTQVYAAAIANLVIAASKFVAAFITGSSAMLSEGIHSVADTANQLLLLFGIKRSRKPADETHPFGYGREIYFWGFIVAIVLFGLGGGISIYEGIIRLQEHGEVSSPFWAFVVLAIAIGAESMSFWYAFKAFGKSVRPGENWWRAFRTSKDPAVFVVIAEDAAALAGLVVAAAGLTLEQLTQSVVPDAIASIVIGLILAAVAFLMGLETKGLLLGESTDPETVEEIKRIARRDPLVAYAHAPLTMHLGPNEILLNMVVDFHTNASREAIRESIDRLEAEILDQFPAIRRIFIEPETSQSARHRRRTGSLSSHTGLSAP